MSCALPHKEFSLTSWRPRRGQRFTDVIIRQLNDYKGFKYLSCLYPNASRDYWLAIHDKHAVFLSLKWHILLPSLLPSSPSSFFSLNSSSRRRRPLRLSLQFLDSFFSSFHWYVWLRVEGDKVKKIRGFYTAVSRCISGTPVFCARQTCHSTLSSMNVAVVSLCFHA